MAIKDSSTFSLYILYVSIPLKGKLNRHQMLVTAEHTLKHHNSKKACMLNSILPILRITIGNLPIYTSAEIYKGTFDISNTNKSSAYLF